jgi:hypothetical protein
MKGDTDYQIAFALVYAIYIAILMLVNLNPADFFGISLIFITAFSLMYLDYGAECKYICDSDNIIFFYPVFCIFVFLMLLSPHIIPISLTTYRIVALIIFFVFFIAPYASSRIHEYRYKKMVERLKRCRDC